MSVSDSWFAALLAASQDGVLGYDRDLRYTLWSAGMERISGMPASAVLGRVATDVFPFLAETGEDQAMRGVLRGDRVTTRQQFAVPETQRAGRFAGTYTPVRDGDTIIGGLGVIQDVTELWLGSERLALALRASDLGPWEWDAATDIVTFSDRAAEIFGIPPGPQMTWTQMRELLHPDDRDRARVSVEQAIAAHTPYDIAYRVQRPDGREVWVAALARAYYDEAGKPASMLGVVQDITARKQAELDELRTFSAIDRVGTLLLRELDLEKLLQAITDAGTELCDAQFGAFFYNHTRDDGEVYMLYTLSGAPREAFAKFGMPRNTKLFAPTFAGTRIVRSDDITRDRDYGQNPPHSGMPKGHLPVRSYLAVPVTSASGAPIGGLFFGHEAPGVFTARHERIIVGIATQAAIAIENAQLYRKARDAEQEARQRAEALALADRHKDDFLAMLAHELRNPLGAISNAVYVMSRSKPGEQAFERSIEIAKRQIAHQRKLVDDLLDVSRVARGKMHLQRARLDIVALVTETVEDHRPAIAKAGLVVELQAPSTPLFVDGDRVRLAQVLGNLLDNARKFTRSGGRITVHVTTESTGHVHVCVADTGIGIDPALLPQLFSPFTQAETTLARSQGGLGLGLALAKGLVELHDGRIDARSEPERGTAMTIVLPLIEGAVVVAPAERVPQLQAGAHVLVIDDLHDAADTLRDLLVLMGCTVDVAYNATQGIAAFRERRPDIVLCDLGLPGELSGYDVARVLRSEHAGAQVRLIALTGYGAEADQRKSREAGFDLHLTKPLRPELLGDLIRPRR